MKFFKRGCALLLLLTILVLAGGIVMAVWLLSPLFTEGANVLILFNNTDEMRGSGGFTTAYMTITRQSGDFVTHFGSSYEIDTPPDASGAVLVVPPPKPMHDYMGIDRWSFRDANWSPDYPTSAQAASRFYTQVTGAQEPVYVITVNMSAARTLMRHLPHLRIDNQFIDALSEDCDTEVSWKCEDTDILDWLRAGWDVSASGPEGDKAFVKERAEQLIEGVRSLDILHQVDVVPALFDMLGRGDVLLYSSDTPRQAFFAARRWSGPFPLPTDHDVIFYSENNIGYNKTSAQLERTFTYDLDFRTDPPSASLTIHYKNMSIRSDPTLSTCQSVDSVEAFEIAEPTYQDRMTGCAWIYGQVYPLPGSKLTGASIPGSPPDQFPFGLRGETGRVDAIKDGGVKGWGYALAIPYGEERIVILSYTLPLETNAQTHYAIDLPALADMSGVWDLVIYRRDSSTLRGYGDIRSRTVVGPHE